MEEALDDAKTRYPHLTFDVRWRPFELDPRLPTGEGKDKMKHYEAKFGADNIRRMIPRMKATAREHGINMEYGGNVGNTFDSHRLIWKAREVGGSELQDKVVESIFKAYFEENKSLGDSAVLEECANRAGMKDTKDFLTNSQLGRDEVEREKNEFGQAFQCNGVPMFVIDERFVLHGAQEKEAFLRTFGKVSMEL